MYCGFDVFWFWNCDGYCYVLSIFGILCDCLGLTSLGGNFSGGLVVLVAVASCHVAGYFLDYG